MNTSENTAVIAPPDTAEGSGKVLRVSPSKLSTWSFCPLKYRYHYIDNVEVPTGGAQFLGSCIHRALESYNRARWLNQKADLPLALATFETAWKEREKVEFDDAKEESKLCADGEKLLALYLTNYPPDNSKPEAVEVPVDGELIDETTGEVFPELNGIIDLVEGGVIVDFKTTARNMNNDLLSLANEVQLTAYSILYRQATGKDEAGLEIRSLIRTKDPSLCVTSISPRKEVHHRRFLNLVRAFVENVRLGNYPPAPSINCMLCDYRRQCARI
jgi:putative RecB family exonuclease